MKLFFKNIRTKKSLKKGFTLIELLVTITIFVVITGVVLVNSNNFNSSELLNNFAYDTALTIKLAQTYGANVKENSLGFFNTNYGVYFNIDPAIGGGGSNTNFVLYNDTGNSVAYGIGIGDNTPDGIYNGSMTSCPVSDPECVQRYTVNKGLFIKSLCTGNDKDHCSAVNQLSILFQRPNLNAMIYYLITSTQRSSAQAYAQITLSSATGATSSVVITSIGQIYVKK